MYVCTYPTVPRGLYLTLLRFYYMQGHPHVDLNDDDCKMGVALTRNDGRAFTAHNLCDTWCVTFTACVCVYVCVSMCV